MSLYPLLTSDSDTWTVCKPSPILCNSHVLSIASSDSEPCNSKLPVDMRPVKSSGTGGGGSLGGGYTYLQICTYTYIYIYICIYTHMYVFKTFCTFVYLITYLFMTVFM